MKRPVRRFLIPAFLWLTVSAAAGGFRAPDGSNPGGDSKAVNPEAGVTPEDQVSEPEKEAANDSTILETDGIENDLLDLSLEELMDVEVVVTAGRHEQRITSVSYAVSVITADEIRASGARSIPDALRLVPGMDVAQLTYGNAAVSPRGFHGFLGRQMLVLVDGRQIFDSFFGGTLWGGWPFLLEDIERIEVIRGPGGVTWGANAVNGVVNIITKDPADQQGITLSIQGGNRGFHKEYTGVGIVEDDARFRISLEYEGHEGFFRGGSILGTPDDQFRAARGSLYGIIEPSEDDRITLSFGSSVMQGGYARTPTAGIGAARKPESHGSYLMTTWTHQVSEDNHFDVTAYVNDFFGSPGIQQADYRYQQIALQFAHSFKPAENHTMSWGIDTRLDVLDGSNSYPQMLSRPGLVSGIVGAYIQDEWRFAPQWILELGGRLDYEFYGGFQPSARAALAYELNETSLIYGSVSRAFQMPPVGLRFVEMPILNGLAVLEGDAEINSETLIAYEIGYRGRIGEKLDLTLNAFINDLDDITTVSARLGPPGLLALDFGNRASALFYGIECGATYRVNDQLTLLGNYTYQQMNWNSSVPFYDKDAVSAPAHKAMIGARYSPHEDVHLSGQLFFVDSVDGPRPEFPFIAKEIGSYFRLDLRAEFDLWDDNASLAFGVRNLLDNSHPEGTTNFMNSAEVPRMVFMEMRMRIGAPHTSRRTVGDVSDKR